MIVITEKGFRRLKNSEDDTIKEYGVTVDVGKIKVMRISRKGDGGGDQHCEYWLENKNVKTVSGKSVS